MQSYLLAVMLVVHTGMLCVTAVSTLSYETALYNEIHHLKYVFFVVETSQPSPRVHYTFSVEMTTLSLAIELRANWKP